MATIRDVAKQAGVSAVTVSRVINDMANVRPSTRARVLKAVEELNYVPSGVARSLRSRQTRTLALMVPDIANAFWTTIARGVEDAAQSRGYSVLLCNTDENPAKQRRYLTVVVGQQVDGVIVAPYDSDASNLALLRDKGIPTVLVDREIQGWDVDTVTGDSFSPAVALVKHLIGLGHRRIAVISGPSQTSTAVDRVAGYCLALVEAGLRPDPELIRFGEFRLESGLHLALEILATARPTAFFAANNLLAMGVIDAVGRHGLHIPQDIALVCMDDLPDTSRVFPFLTVAVQPAYEIGVTAARLLLNRLESGSADEARHVVMPSHLIIRRSCGSALGAGLGCQLSLPIGQELPPSPEQAVAEAGVAAKADAYAALARIVDITNYGGAHHV